MTSESKPAVDRHRAREVVLGLLYQWELTGDAGGDSQLDEEPLGTQRAFAEALYHGVLRHLDELDRILSTRTHGWRYERISVVDRSILRLAAYELLLDKEIPAEVAIDEAVELCKTFGTDASPSFVNGILARLWEEGVDAGSPSVPEDPA